MFCGDAKCLTQRVGDRKDEKYENSEGKVEFKMMNKFSSSFY